MDDISLYLSVGTTDIRGRIILGGRGHTMYDAVCRNDPGHSPLDANGSTRTPSNCDIETCLQMLPIVPWGEKSHLVVNHCSVSLP